MISKIYAIIFCLMLTGISTGMQVNQNEALLTAVRAGDLAAAVTALNAGANPDYAVDRSSPLSEAGIRGNLEIAELLIMRGATIDQRLGHSVTALMRTAVRGKETTTARLLVQHRANINAQDNDRMTPLMYAAWKGKTDTVRLLLEHQADINLDGDGETALDIAWSGDRQSVVQLLLDAKAGTK